MEYDHDKHQRTTTTNLNWPIQGKPDTISFNKWRKYIKLCFLNANNHRPNPLGGWDINEILTTSPRTAYYHQSESIVYIPNGAGTFNVHEVYEIGRQSARYDPDKTTQNEPTVSLEAIPIDTYKYSDDVLFKFTRTTEVINNIKATDNNEWKHKILQHMDIPNIDTLKLALEDPLSTIYIVSDGGCTIPTVIME
jgi:hypothetical protein